LAISVNMGGVVAENWIVQGGSTKVHSDYQMDQQLVRYTRATKQRMQGSLFDNVTTDKSRVGFQVLLNGMVCKPNNMAAWMVPQVRAGVSKTYTRWGVGPVHHATKSGGSHPV
jgi:hypothetical protein